MKAATGPSSPKKIIVPRPPKEDFEKAWYNPNLRRIDIVKMFGVSKSLCKIIAEEFGLPSIRDQIDWSNKEPDPTPEEILQRSAEVRRKWSDAERSRRMNVKFKEAIC